MLALSIYSIALKKFRNFIENVGNKYIGNQLEFIGEFVIHRYKNLDQFKKLAYDLIISYERNLLIDKIL